MLKAILSFKVTTALLLLGLVQYFLLTGKEYVFEMTMTVEEMGGGGIGGLAGAMGLQQAGYQDLYVLREHLRGEPILDEMIREVGFEASEARCDFFCWARVAVQEDRGGLRPTFRDNFGIDIDTGSNVMTIRFASYDPSLSLAVLRAAETQSRTFLNDMALEMRNLQIRNMTDRVLLLLNQRATEAFMTEDQLQQFQRLRVLQDFDDQMVARALNRFEQMIVDPDMNQRMLTFVVPPHQISDPLYKRRLLPLFTLVLIGVIADIFLLIFGQVIRQNRAMG